MKVVGISCTKDGASVVVLSGTRQQPSVEEERSFPALDDIARGVGLSGVRRQLVSLFEKHSPDAVRVRPAGNQAQAPEPYRIYLEGVALEAAAAAGVADVSLVTFHQIAKALSVFAKGEAIRAHVKDAFPSVGGNHSRDALSAAWAALPSNQ